MVKFFGLIRNDSAVYWLYQKRDQHVELNKTANIRRTVRRIVKFCFVFLKKNGHMKKILCLVFLWAGTFVQAQDTTWVQTFTFDTIVTRRANFVFPQQLNDQRFEKVLMYYKLKCSPLTTWDQYNCGEWDYLTYTRVFDHTGQFDSIQVNGNQFLANHNAAPSIQYDPITSTYADTYVREEHNRSGANTTTFQIGSSAQVMPLPFDLSNNGGRYQMLITAAELANAGIVAGDLQSLSLYLNSFVGSGELKYPRISLKSTTDATLTSMHTSGFTNVYDASHWSGGSQPALVNGQNELLFYQSFAWNGTDNIIVEFMFENSIPASNGLLFDGSASTQDALVYNKRNGCISFSGTNHSLLELSDFDMGNDMTITFWSKGSGSAGTNTSILEAYDTVGNRIVNIHMPWSDNNMYFDAGEGPGYDRIFKAMSTSEIDNNWNHWAFVKKQATGEMFIYKNGSLWHSGTNKNRPVGYIHRFVLGANMNYGNNWKGKVDDFQVYDVPLDAATIQSWMTKKPDASHPNWNDLLVYYDFDNKAWAEDMSQNDYLLMPSQQGMFNFTEYPNAGVETASFRPKVGFGQGTVAGTMQTTQETELRLEEPTVVFEFQSVPRHFEISNAFVGVVSGNQTVYNAAGAVVSQTPFTGSTAMNNQPIVYFQQPFEILKDVEIARYITPYGIQFDLGPQGFTWIYDVTDYQHYLKDTVDLAAHNTQELIDLKFAFIEGIPPRDVHKREPIWADFRSYGFASMANNTELANKAVLLSDTSDMFKIKTRLSGHGQVGNGACCEWVPNDHQIRIEGVPRFNWNIWEVTDCGDNPNTGQGGTWPYAREGWCPGDKVKEYEFEITSFVTPGDSAHIDYAINDVPANDPGQAGGNYIVAMDLISYSAPNFQHDAAIVDVLNPNNYEYYRKWNPTCNNPRVVLQNTGEQPLTSCIIRCWITYGGWFEYNWTGNLGFLEKEVVEIPIDNIGWWQDYDSTETFTAQVYAVQGFPDLDEYPHNNAFRTKFKAPDAIFGPFYVWMVTNNKANENSYRLEDADGNVIFERTQLTNNTTYKDTFDLAQGCYSLILEDTDHDGTGFWYSSQVEGETSGQFRVRLVGGSYVEIFPGDFGRYHRYNFSVGFALGEDEIELKHQVDVFPNPTSGHVTIEVSGDIKGQADLWIYDLTGRLVHNESMIATTNFAEAHPDLTHLLPGQYIIKVTGKDMVYSKHLVKN
jgi:hypothetical protein